jgi:hypothetical protein
MYLAVMACLYDDMQYLGAADAMNCIDAEGQMRLFTGFACSVCYLISCYQN